MHRRYSVKGRFNESFVSREQSSYQSLFAQESQQLSQHDQIVGRKELTDRRKGGNINLNLKTKIHINRGCSACKEEE